MYGIIAILAIALLIASDKARSTLVLVVVAVAVSGGLWVGANVLFNQARVNWQLFNGIRYAVVGFLVGALISGNRLTNGSGEGDGFFGRLVSWIWMPLIVAAAAGVVGLLLSRTDEPSMRLAVGAGGVGAIGALVGILLRDEIRPDLDIVALVGWTVVIGALGAGVSMLRKKPPVHGALIGGAIGWFLGAFGAPDLGTGNAGWAIVAAAVPAAAIGARIAIVPNGGLAQQTEVDRRSRPVIFLAPALMFVTATLVIPALRTFYLSFLDRDSEDFVGVDNYTETFTNDTSLDLSGWGDMFFNWPMRFGLLLLVIFVVIGRQAKQRTGRLVELGSPSMFPMLIGGMLVAFAVFTTLRGTIINNLWWVVVVTLFSTSLGLAVAVLADGVSFEKVAKSLIFMPMAISLVGASVIWRFMYVARDSSKEQTGVLNAMWVGLGRLSTGQGIAATVLVAIGGMAALALLLNSITKRRYAVALATIVGAPLLLFAIAWLWAQASGDVQRLLLGGFVTAVFLGIGYAGLQSIQKGQYGQAAVPGVAVLLLGWFLWRFWGITGGGVGGFKTNTAGSTVGDPINFIQSSPYNNMFLMIVLIWIQTGFAMVILSAAIKAVPTEIIEAARVDGATTSQVFWRVTLPQVAPTIGVVVTTIIVLVMKVFDIVKVMTNSNFGTQVLANDMFTQAFSNTNTGRGASLAMLIFFSVLPVMIMNIRRMQQEN